MFLAVFLALVNRCGENRPEKLRPAFSLLLELRPKNCEEPIESSLLLSWYILIVSVTSFFHFNFVQ